MSAELPNDLREPSMTLEEAVWLDSGRMSGAPCFRGTRLPVQQMFDWLADGTPLDEFLDDFKVDPRAADAVLRAAGAPGIGQGSVLNKVELVGSCRAGQARG